MEPEVLLVAFSVSLLNTFLVLVGGSGRGKTLMHSSVSESMSGLYTRDFFPADLEDVFGIEVLEGVLDLLLGEGWTAVVGSAEAKS
jgi:hypothetical protein